MPCRTDYMEPNRREVESKLVADLLVYTAASLYLDLPKYVGMAKSTRYGNPGKLDEMTALLCATCKEMSVEDANRIIWNGKVKLARKLANWWEEHKAADDLREAKERRLLIYDALAKEATEILSGDQFHALKKAILEGKI